MTDAPRDHFRIREVIDSPEHTQQQVMYVQPERDMASIATMALWVFTSWTIVFINIILGVVCIRDMLTLKYEPMTHWFMSAVFVATIFGLVATHTWVIKKNSPARV